MAACSEKLGGKNDRQALEEAHEKWVERQIHAVAFQLELAGRVDGEAPDGHRALDTIVPLVP